MASCNVMPYNSRTKIFKVLLNNFDLQELFSISWENLKKEEPHELISKFRILLRKFSLLKANQFKQLVSFSPNRSKDEADNNPKSLKKIEEKLRWYRNCLIKHE